MHYHIQPVNEYENTECTVYENYRESGGYEEAVYSTRSQQKSASSQDGYEVPLKTEHLTYDILSESPVEVTFFVDT